MKNWQIYSIIARILSLKVNPEAVTEVAKSLPTEKKDWQKLVFIGSKNLVLQSLYLSLRDHHLLKLLPQELVEHFEYLHELNIERNTKIIRQIDDIQKVFSTLDIDFILLKGTGNILDGVYRDVGERMVYDIDLLVEDGKMLKAAQALQDEGYRTQKKFNSLAYPSTMHYPILVSENYVAGVEIHRIPVQYHYLKSFSAERVFASRKPALTNPQVWVMSDENRIIHNFLHSQLMHNAHYHADISIRDLYDFLLLSQRVDDLKVFDDFGFYRSKSNAYINLVHKVFEVPEKRNQKKGFVTDSLIARHRFCVSLTRKQLKIYMLLFSSIIKYVVLPVRTIFNRNARNYVFSRLGNKYWYKDHFNAYKRHLSGKRELVD